jgi:DNA-binding NtrC family response regulator
LLDEVGDLPLAVQVKLLRTLQEGEVKRVGSDETRTVDVRVIAATNVDLRAKIENGSFRSDLFYRLNVIAITLPPLRERGSDVEQLAYHSLEKHARRMGREPKKLAADAIAALRAYPWPGNVRELEHAMERALVLSQGELIHASDLPFEVDKPASEQQAALLDQIVELAPGLAAFPPSLADQPFADAKKAALAIFEDAYVAEVLKRASGNMSEAARLAGLDRTNFKRIVRRAKGE